MKTDRDRILWLQGLLAERENSVDRLSTTEAGRADATRASVRILIGSTVVAVCGVTAAALAA